MNGSYWKDKRVLITGHTGFKGSWLAVCLLELGAKVTGYALEPYTDRDNFVLAGLSERLTDLRGDIRDGKSLQEAFCAAQPEVVFHLAAQPLVRLSYEKPVETYEVNVMGTLQVLECIRHTDSVRTGILITTDKCYENREQLYGYRETDRFGGYDPYSSSKACDEILISSYRNSFFPLSAYETHKKAIASVRAGNVIGGGDWAKDRIIPDCIRALETDGKISIRNPNAIRPWEHVLEPLSGYILLAEKLAVQPEKYSGGWNFGPETDSFVNVWEVARMLTEEYGRGELEDSSGAKAVHEAKLLFLDITKAKLELGWRPRMKLRQAIHMTAEWYRRCREEDAYELCREQFREFQRL